MRTLNQSTFFHVYADANGLGVEDHNSEKQFLLKLMIDGAFDFVLLFLLEDALIHHLFKVVLKIAD